MSVSKNSPVVGSMRILSLSVILLGVKEDALLSHERVSIPQYILVPADIG